MLRDKKAWSETAKVSLSGIRFYAMELGLYFDFEKATSLVESGSIEDLRQLSKMFSALFNSIPSDQAVRWGAFYILGELCETSEVLY